MRVKTKGKERRETDRKEKPFGQKLRENKEIVFDFEI